MKTIRVTTSLTFLLLAAFPAFCPAQEANPFDKSKSKPTPAKETPDSETTSTEHHAPLSYAKLTECILVQADVLNAWLETNPLQADATKLRSTIQGWIAEGKAFPDHTSLSRMDLLGGGSDPFESGGEVDSVSARELMYPTDYEILEGGTDQAWPHPGSWETRNLGYEVRDSLQPFGDREFVNGCDFRFNALVKPFDGFNQLLEQTRQPGDIVNPTFRALQFNSAIPSGITSLLLRADEASARPSDKAKPEPRLVRLVFSQTAPLAPSGSAAKQTQEPSTEAHTVSTKLVRVDHRVYSDWLHKTGLKSAATSAWAATSGWIQSGSASVSDQLAGSLRYSATSALRNADEIRYPTEWEPIASRPAKDSQSYPEMNFSLPTSFETRDAGLTLDFTATPSEAPSMAVHLQYRLNRVRLADKLVYSRIHRRGQWVPDTTMPVFAVNKWEGACVLEKGVWTLVGSGSDFDDKGELDPKQAVLAFIRVD